MCKLCDEAAAAGKSAPIEHSQPETGEAPDTSPTPASPARRRFLATSVAGSASAMLAACGGAAAQAAPGGLPAGVGDPGRRTIIRGGSVLSMDSKVGNFATGDVLVEGSKILDVGANVSADGAAVIDATGMIVMPGFVDTHHHQFETALRSFLANGVLMSDGRPETAVNYYDTILKTLSMVYRPEDVYINELFGSLAQMDAGVTTVLDVSQIHHSPQHSDAAVQALQAAGRRAVMGYFEGWGPDAKYPTDAARIKTQWFSSNDQLATMAMGGEIYLPGYDAAWQIGRQLGLPVALHVVGSFGVGPTFDQLGAAGKFGPDNIFIHMTGMSDAGWQYAADAGAHVSIAVPIEMQMRHGTPQIQRALDLGMQLSLSTDVECTMTADMFSQVRFAMTLQRMFANELALQSKPYPTLMTPFNAIRLATIEGAKGLMLDKKTGSLTPGKEADIILLKATAPNVAPLNNVPGAVATLMDRSNVDTVMVAGKLKKWQGELVGVDMPSLRRQLEASRDYLFATAGVQRDLFGN